MFANKTITTISHDIIRRFVSKGQTTIDATAGNGNDTIFLSELVGEQGRVFAFDVQLQAIEQTKRLTEKMNAKNVVLINDGHENIDKYDVNEISVAVFNLGYLPNGDKSKITKPHTTITAISKCLERLIKGGAIIVVCYYAHEGGADEKMGLEHYFAGIKNDFLVSKIDFVNRPNKPPIIYIIEKC